MTDFIVLIAVVIFHVIGRPDLSLLCLVGYFLGILS